MLRYAEILADASAMENTIESTALAKWRVEPQSSKYIAADGTNFSRMRAIRMLIAPIEDDGTLAHVASNYEKFPYSEDVRQLFLRLQRRLHLESYIPNSVIRTDPDTCWKVTTFYIDRWMSLPAVHIWFLKRELVSSYFSLQHHT